MNEIEKGLFAMEGPMPCPPSKIRIGRYSLPDTLGNTRKEEAAARIISLSQEAGQWVGVSWPRIEDMIKEDYEKEKAYWATKLNHHNERMEDWLRQLYLYFLLCFLTIGIWAVIVNKPKRTTESQEHNLPSSGIYISGPQHVVTGIAELLKLNMLEKVTRGDGEDTIDVLLPTPELISIIMKKQGIAQA